MATSCTCAARLVHLCRMRPETRECYSSGMKPEQEVIASWMRQVMERVGLTANEWARRAKKAPTTITRAIDGSSEHVTSVPTLHLLAQKAGVPSVLDFLAGEVPPDRTPISADGLTPLLSALLPLVPKRRLSETDVRDLAEALAFGLQLLPADPATQANEGVVGVAAQAAVARFRETSAGS